jgi:predicted regulator of Ras-like GTPase activity (Roadblock/LC7/MglB family)
MPDALRIPGQVAAAAAAEVDAIAAELTGVRAVVVATADGLELAARVHGNADARRLSALASSMSAIADVVSSEAGLVQPGRVTVAAGDGFALVQAVPRRDAPMVVIVLAGAEGVLAQANYRVAAAVRRLESA